jgi:Protein of unknown function (DUF3326)
MKVFERELTLPIPQANKSNLFQIRDSLEEKLGHGSFPVRFAITKTDELELSCEIGVCEDTNGLTSQWTSIFDYRQRPVHNTKEFNTVFLVPTGIGAELGGHAGDATPVARMLASCCDNLITHPNVVNASDINEMSDNTWYVEGSVISRLLMGTVGLSKTYSNRILALIEKHPRDDLFTNAAINAVNAARATQGLDCARIEIMESGPRLEAEYSSSGSAVGVVDNMSEICDLMERNKGDYDAVAIVSIIDLPRSYHKEYFQSKGAMINPWGGAEAIFTHTLSHMYNVPTAHSPMLEDQLVANMDYGVVDPRMAAEAVSIAFLQCVLKGLQRSPKIVTDEAAMNHHSVYTAADVSCLVIPEGVLGLPTLAALEQGIKVIAVKENKNLMQNDLSLLPWARGQFLQVDNYLEALGAMVAMKEGLSIESLRRPMLEEIGATAAEAPGNPGVRAIR